MNQRDQRRAATIVNPPLSIGVSPIPSGTIASVVTYLEMNERPPSRNTPAADLPRPLLWRRPEVDAYRALYRMIGQEWLWFSRLAISDKELRAILADSRVQVYVLNDGPQQIGLLELDFREEGHCELAFFGLKKEAIGRGLGRFLMNFAIERAWSEPIERLWLHTCSFDHPDAVAFYRRSGFHPYAFMVEVIDDPRLSGLIPRDSAPHVPLLL
jgi:GNAT superfamily N-acetyltransferase